MSNSILYSDDYSLDKRKTISITNVSKTYVNESKSYKLSCLYKKLVHNYIKKICILIVIILLCILYTKNYDLLLEYYKLYF